MPDSLYFSVYYVFVMSISVSTLCQGLSDEDISLHLPKRLCFIISGAGPWWHVSGCGAGLWWHVSGCGAGLWWYVSGCSAGLWWYVSGCGAGLWWYVSGCGAGMYLVEVLVLVWLWCCVLTRPAWPNSSCTAVLQAPLQLEGHTWFSTSVTGDSSRTLTPFCPTASLISCSTVC